MMCGGGAVDMSKRSDCITDFLDFIKAAEGEYKHYSQLMETENKLSQDILHKLELETTKAPERNRIATRLATCRKDRRFYKDHVEELEPIYQLVTDPKMKPFVEQLKQVLGQVRKQEKYHQSRTYRPKVLNNPEANDL